MEEYTIKYTLKEVTTTKIGSKINFYLFLVIFTKSSEQQKHKNTQKKGQNSSYKVNMKKIETQSMETFMHYRD